MKDTLLRASPRSISLWIILTVLLALCSTLVSVIVVDDASTRIASLLGVTGKSDVIARLAVALGGALVALQAWASYGRAKSLEDTVRSQHRANETAERGQRQERLNRGIDHLGSESESVRLGGAYELLHLAREFRGFRRTVVDILCAHIRQTTGKRTYKKRFREQPSTEIQSLLTLLLINEADVFKDCRVDLSRSWLVGAELRRARLGRANLARANLSECVLPRANLAGAVLIEAKLQGAYAVRADFRGAALFRAELQGANLGRCRMQAARLRGASLQAANVAYVEFQGAELYDTAMQGCNFKETDFRGATPRSLFDSERPRLVELAEEESDLRGVVFSGGVESSEVEMIVLPMSDKTGAKVRDRLESHVGSARERAIPKGVIVGSYSAEEAREWL